MEYHIPKKIKVYVSATLSDGDTLSFLARLKNTIKAIRIADKLLRMGYIPFVPHLTFFWGIFCKHKYQEWLNYDFEWLDDCDCMLRAKGKSQGADKETVGMKAIIGKPVYHSIKELVDNMPANPNWKFINEEVQERPKN